MTKVKTYLLTFKTWVKNLQFNDWLWSRDLLRLTILAGNFVYGKQQTGDTTM